MLHEVGITAEVVVFAVLEDEDTVVLQQVVLKDKPRNGRQFLQRVGWVGEDEVVLLLATLDEAENIGTNGISPPYGPRGGFFRLTDYSVPLVGRKGGILGL